MRCVCAVLGAYRNNEYSMFDYSNSGVTLTALLDSRRKCKDGLYSVRIRVTYNRVQKYYPTGKTLSIEDWEKLPTTRSKNLIDIRSEIQVSVDKVKDNIKRLIKNDTFTFDALNRRLGNATGDTLNIAFTSKIEELAEKGKISTSDWYRYTLRSLELFAGKKIKFTQVNIDWLHRYEKYLLSEGKSYTTISMYMRALQVIMNVAKHEGVLQPSQHPFGKGKYEIPQHEGRSIALSKSDILKISSYECETETVEMCRDLWLFLYLCNGANITDVCKLQFLNIRNGEVCFYRQKTLAKAKRKRLIQAILTPKMEAIIERWGNNGAKADDFIFPFIKGDENPKDERRIIKNITHLINDKMKAIGKKLGIGNISTYTARHSYASVLKRGGANIAYISESMGHADIKITEDYLARFEQEERVKNAALLGDF